MLEQAFLVYQTVYRTLRTNQRVAVNTAKDQGKGGGPNAIPTRD